MGKVKPIMARSRVQRGSKGRSGRVTPQAADAWGRGRRLASKVADYKPQTRAVSYETATGPRVPYRR